MVGTARGGGRCAGRSVPAAPETTLAASASSVGRARGLVRDALLEWGVPEDTADTAVLLTSEIATNAVLHARTPFTVSVRLVSGRVRVGVQDGSVARPVVQHYGRTQTTGRGLRLLATLAQDWGFDSVEGGGKAVWFELPLVPSSDAVTGLEAAFAAEDVEWLKDLDELR
jgi:anti-sigma regulatory factor (Ser/Thr protein kinase)